jgi:hypothetical protein
MAGGVFKKGTSIFHPEIVVEGDLLGRFAKFGGLENGIGRHTGVPNERNAAHFAWNDLDNIATGPVHVSAPLVILDSFSIAWKAD